MLVSCNVPGLHSTLSLHSSSDCHVLFDMNEFVSRPHEAWSLLFESIWVNKPDWFLSVAPHFHGVFVLTVFCQVSWLPKPQLNFKPQKPLRSLQVAAFGLHVASTLEPVAALSETLRVV